MYQDFETAYSLSITKPEIFWNEIAKDVTWSKPYTSVLIGKDNTSPEWFVNGEINLCYNCLDKQIENGYGNEIAVIYESPVTKTIEYFTYANLLKPVELIAGIMVEKCGINKGDKVFLYMPVNPQCLIAMLACARIGATYTSTFAGFAMKEVAFRIKHFHPKLIFTTNVGVTRNEIFNYKNRIDSAIELSKFDVQYCIVYNLLNYDPAELKIGRDLEWNKEILSAKPQTFIPVESSHPLFVSYTSGTTDNPKGLVFETGGSCVVNKFVMKYLFDLQPGEAIFCYSTFSWILGQTYLSFASLLSRTKTIIYEDQPCERNHFLEILRILEQHKVVTLICIPTVFRNLKRYCFSEDFPTEAKNLRTISLTGELSSENLFNWIKKMFHCRVYNMWGQTELGNFGTSPPLGFKPSNNSSQFDLKTTLVPGICGKVVDTETGNDLPYGSKGRFLLKLPLTPGAASTIYGNHKKFEEIYYKTYPGYYDTKDCAIIHLDRSVQILSRDDDIIHVASARISGTAIEEACLKNPDLEQVSVVALKDSIKGFVPFGFLVPHIYNSLLTETIICDTIQFVMDEVGQVASFQQAVVIPALPKNKSGKTLKGTLESIVNGKEFTIPAMCEDQEIYMEIYNVLLKSGYNPGQPIK